MDYKFLYANIAHPEGKVSLKLGSTKLAKGYLKYFNHRSPKRVFLKNKKFNIAAINIQEIENELAYISTIKGKNSADYFARRCQKMGYTFSEFNPNEFIEDIHAIHLSASERQGRSMDSSYLVKVESWVNDKENNWYGVFDTEGKLVAYLWLVLMNELALVNRILGHGDHLKSNVMYLGTLRTIAEEIEKKKRKMVVYDTFGKSKNGLVMFKKRLGFKPYTINFKE